MILQLSENFASYTFPAQVANDFFDDFIIDALRDARFLGDILFTLS